MVEPFVNFIGLLGLVILGLFVWAALSPFEVLGWWAGWFGDTIYDDQIPSDGLVREVRPDADSYILFLSGIGRVSGETFSRRERGFLQRLAHAMPNAVIIDDVFPYSINNRALTGQRFFAGLWRFALRRKLGGPSLAGYLINIRNILQVAISGDHRYGPIYNQATAEVLLHGLLRYDYPLDDRIPVYVIGYSGGAQMAVGAATYLSERLEAPVYVISLGGIFVSDPGLLAVEHLYHLYGTEDRARFLGQMAPGRWPLFPASEWNRALRQGRVSVINMGAMGHTGRHGYLDQNSLTADGLSFIDRTVQVVVSIVDLNVNSFASALQTDRNKSAVNSSQSPDGDPIGGLSREDGIV